MSLTPASPDNQAIRELRDEVKKLSVEIRKATKETSTYSAWFMILALVGMVVGAGQFTLQALDTNHRGTAAIYGLLLIAVVTFGIYVTRRNKNL